jgi:hypothetical protein
MTNIDKYSFTVSLSKESFIDKETSAAMIGSIKHKPNASKKDIEECEKNKRIREKHGWTSGVSFEEHTLTSQELCEFLTTGKMMCHLFNPQRFKSDGTFGIEQKKNDNFRGSYVVGLDVDETKFQSISEYLNTLTLKPTIYYSSYSHLQEGKGVRFRLLYIFDEMIDSIYKFRYIGTLLTNMVERDTGEKFHDKCGRSCSQYFNGTCKYNTKLNIEYGNNNLIYSLSDVGYSLDGYVDFLKSGCDHYSVKNTFTIEDELNRLGIETDTNQSTTNEGGGYSSQIMNILNDWDRLSEEEFKRTPDWNDLRNKTKYIYRCDNNEWEYGRIQKVDDDYFRLYWHSHTLKDGKKRRKTLFENMCLRRIMKPDITKDEMVVNTIIDTLKFVDNDDRVIGSEYIIRNVDNCFDLTTSEIEENYERTLYFLRKETAPKRGFIYKNKEARSKETTYLQLDNMVNPNLSVTENIEMIKIEYDFPVSKSTLYNYYKDRELSTKQNKLSDEEIYALLNPNLSIRKNREFLNDNDIKISEKKLRALLKKKKELSLFNNV